VTELFRRFDNVFFEKTRLSMMTVLYQEGTVSFNMFKERLAASDGAIYTHLEKLISAGYVHKKKEIAGTEVQTVYFPTRKGRSLFSDYLDFIEDLLRSTRNNPGNQGE
jgi:predicted ArsR family transcriptional regulator